MLRPSFQVRYRRSRHLEPQPPPIACGGADLHAAPVADASEQRREIRPAGREVVRALQLGPRVRAQRLNVVHEHLQQRRVAFDQFALGADARDPDGRALEDRAVVGLAALQRDRRLRAVDELADLGTGHREHGHDLAVDVWPSSSEQHQETADGAPGCDGACHLDSQPRAARGLADQRLARGRHLFVHRRHPRSDGPAHQAAVRVQRHVVSGAVELGEPRIVRVP